MKRNEWAQITAAKEILGLEDYATVQDIKKAYRRMSKKYHPDVAGKNASDMTVSMQQISDAYQLLMQYCKNYRFPLTPGGKEEMDAEDWWFERFGNDPLWSKG